MMSTRRCRNTEQSKLVGAALRGCPLLQVRALRLPKRGGHGGPPLHTCLAMRASAESQQPQSLPKPVVEKLKAAMGDKFVLTDRDELLVYEADALTIHKHIPSAVVIPGTAEQVAAAVKILAAERIPFTPRGAGTG